MPKTDITLNIIGIFLIILGITSIINIIYQKNPQGILWFCYIGIIILGIGTLRKNSLLITSQINILAIPLIIWTLDFLYLLILQKPLLGIVNYFFDPNFSLLSKIISLQHLFTIPLSLFVLLKIKIKRKDAWKISLIQLIIILIVTKIFTSPENNINCIYRSCMNISISIIHYIITWLIISFLMIIITNTTINKIFLKSKSP